MSDQYSAELQAYDALGKLMDNARDVRRLFEVAGLPIPPPLGRLLGELQSPATTHGGFRKPTRPVAPPGTKADWIWVPVGEMTPQGIALGLMREASAPMTLKEIGEKVKELLPDTNLRSVYNVGPRLSQDGLLKKVGDGWEMTDASRAPILHAGFAWGPLIVFGKSEAAAHRRECIILLLGDAPDGLQAIQVSRELANCDYFHGVSNKDVVKLDLERLLADKRIRRVSRKWRLASA